MLILAKLAYRNVFRNFRRSLLTFLSLTFGLALSLLSVAFQIGLERSSISTAINTRTGHLKILNSEYNVDEPTLKLDHVINDPEIIINKLENIPAVQKFAEHIIFPASLSDGVDELNLTGIGINPEREKVTFDLENFIIEGSYLEEGEEKILLGDQVAKLFAVKPGDFLTILTRTKYNSINAMDVEVAGIFHLNNPEIDGQGFYFPLKVAQEFLAMENQVTEIVVFANSLEDQTNLVNSVNEILDAKMYATVTWDYLLKDLLLLYKFRARARMIIYFVLFIMASAGIMNTMLMAVYERMGEIGTLMAMGMRKVKLIVLFTLEGIFIGILGSVTGCLLGGFVSYYYMDVGIPMSAFGAGNIQNLPISAVLYPYVTPTMVFVVFIMGIIVALISALYPAIKSSKLEPTEALRAV